MGNLYVIRNNKERDVVIEIIKNHRLPLKVFTQDIYPDRTIDQNAYLWGVVYKYISDYTGHDTLEVHNMYKKRFLIDYTPNSVGRWKFGEKSTSDLSIPEMQDYTDKVRADAWMRHNLVIPLPNECFINELSFIK